MSQQLSIAEGCIIIGLIMIIFSPAIDKFRHMKSNQKTYRDVKGYTSVEQVLTELPRSIEEYKPKNYKK
jgi:hypothetical protein